MGSSCATALIVIATILGPITLVFMAVSFGTDYWLEFDVNRKMLTSPEDKDRAHNLYSHTRHNGLFRTCYPGNDTAFLDNETNVVDGYCVEIQYDLPDKDDVSEEYLVRIHLLRLFLAFFIMALAFFIAAFVVGLILCCSRVSRWAYIAGLFAYCSAFSLAAAIAFFHGAEYMERNKLEDKSFYMSWPKGIQDATTRSYGWSYALGWVAMILATLSATFYSVAGCYISAARYEDRERLEKDHYRGRDYPMYAVDDPYVIKPQPVYASEYGSSHPYASPYIMSSATPRYVMAGAPAAPSDVWNIREAAD